MSLFASFYSRCVFPRLCDFLLGQSFVAAQRRDLLADVGGRILEIGFGTGLNLPHYPAGVRAIAAVDPNPGMQRLALARMRRSAIRVEHYQESGERLPFASGAFDCVVSTFTLCSVGDVDRTVAEVRRVLAPGGRFLFLEHGQSPEPGVAKWQRRLNWLEMRLADGCRLDRNMRDIALRHSFGRVEIREGYLENMPRTHGYVYRGVCHAQDG